MLRLRPSFAPPGYCPLELKAALTKAFAETIEEIGIEAFKATSWFGSNDAARESL
jgi:hypothetical protein